MKSTMTLASAIGIGLLAPMGYGQFGGWGPRQDSAAVNPILMEIGVGDFDGDGLQDFVYWGSNGSTTPVIIRWGESTGSLGSVEHVLAIPAGLEIVGQNRAIHSDDINNDHIDDISIVVRSSDGIGFIRTLGVANRQVASFQYTPAETATGPLTPLGSDLGDADGDGDLDFFLIADVGDGQVYEIENLGQNQFGNARIAYGQESLRDIYTEDLNGDDRVELITTANGGASIKVFSDVFKDGQYSLMSNLSVSAGAQGIISLGEINGDGATDILALWSPPGQTKTVRSYINTGNFTFSGVSSGFLNLNANNRFGGAADLDGDGDLDAIMLRSLPTTAITLINDGTGLYTEVAQISLNATPEFLELLDVDNNTSPDMIWSTQADGNSISTALNLTDVVAPGSFALASPTNGAVDLALPDHYSAWNGGQPEFRWGRATGFSNSYDLSVQTTDGMATEVYAASGVAGTSHPVPNGVLETGTQYAWFVTANNQAGSTDAMSDHVFTTAPGPRLCEPDLNGDGQLDFFDVSIFINAYTAGCP